MILGIGTDIIEIKRIEKATLQSGFLQRWFTESENIFFNNKKNSINSIAGNFAVKEALSKALGTGFRTFSLRDIEVLRNEYGAPYVNLYGNAKKLSTEKNITIIHASISHCLEYAVGYVIVESKGE